MQIPFPGSCPGRLHYVARVSETKTKPHMSCIWTLKPTIMRLNQGLVIYSVQISAPTSPSHAEGTFQTDIMFSFCQSFTIRHNEKEVNEGVLSWTVARIQIHREDSNITVDGRPECAHIAHRYVYMFCFFRKPGILLSMGCSWLSFDNITISSPFLWGSYGQPGRKDLTGQANQTI